MATKSTFSIAMLLLYVLLLEVDLQQKYAAMIHLASATGTFHWTGVDYNHSQGSSFTRIIVQQQLYCTCTVPVEKWF